MIISLLLGCVSDVNALYLMRVGQVDPVSLENAFSRVLIATLLIAVVGFGGAIWLRRRRGTSNLNIKSKGLGALLSERLRSKSGDEIVVTASHRLMSGQSLVSVDWKGQVILLGCTQHTITVLSQQSNAEDKINESNQ